VLDTSLGPVCVPATPLQSFGDASLWAENSVLKRTATATAQSETHTIVFRKLDIMRVVKGNISMLFSPAFCIDVLHMRAEVSARILTFHVLLDKIVWTQLCALVLPCVRPSPPPPPWTQDRSVYHLECLGVLLSKMDTFRRLPRPQLLEVCKHLTVRSFPAHAYVQLTTRYPFAKDASCPYRPPAQHSALRVREQVHSSRGRPVVP
jgi:hypothetical protein